MQHPKARYELDWKTPEQLLVAAVRADGSRDAAVNDLTKVLFARWRRPSRLSTTYVSDLCGRRVSGRLGAAFWATLRFYHFAVPAQIGRLTSGVSRCAFAPF
jgi:hypothetical protein